MRAPRGITFTVRTFAWRRSSSRRHLVFNAGVNGLRRRLSAVLATGLVTLGAGAPAMASDPQVGWLFAVQSEAAQTVSLDPSQDGHERFRLFLRGTAPVTMFSDRPVRVSQRVSPRALVTHWSSWFTGDPPNAVITVPGSDAAPQAFIVTLDDPRWNEKAKRLTFTAVRERPDSTEFNSQSDFTESPTPALMRNVSLFIDNASCRLYGIGSLYNSANQCVQTSAFP